MNHLKAFALIVLLNLCNVSGLSKPYKLCLTKPNDACTLLDVAQSEVECLQVANSVECALKLKSGEAHFGVFSPEEAMLASNFIDNDTSVIFEIRDIRREYEPFRFEAVALVNANYNGGLEGLRGKKLCHPGFKRSQLWTNTVLKFFEEKVMGTPNCTNGLQKSAVEIELQTLSYFFSEMCRPEAWVIDDWLDKKFKRQYANLCTLCKNGCNYRPDMHNMHHAAIDCLTTGGGDVTYVANHYAKEFFGVVGTDRVKYLCPDGTVMDFKNKYPCAWLKQPWDAVVARKDIARKLQDVFAMADVHSAVNAQAVKMPDSTPVRPLGIDMRASRKQEDWPDTVVDILKDRYGKVVKRNNLTSLRDFITEGREIPVTSFTAHCHKKLRWCAIDSTEMEKCSWLSFAALYVGIAPQISCVQGDDKWDCLRMIEQGTADFVGIDTNLGYLAQKRFNLTSVAYQETTAQGNPVIAVVTKSDSQIYNIKDLRNKKACFPEFGGLAWIAAGHSLTGQLEEPVCPDQNSQAEVFSEVCAPGALSKDHTSDKVKDSAALCYLCERAMSAYPEVQTADSCGTDQDNPLYGDVGALRCLASGMADVAVLDVKNISAIIAFFNESNKSAEDYEVLCADGRKVSLTRPLDEYCALSKVLGGEVVARGARTRAISRDISLVLQDLDDWFGVLNRNYRSTFHLYRPFKARQNVLLNSQDVALLHIFNKQNQYINDYSELKKKSLECVDYVPPPPTTATVPPSTTTGTTATQDVAAFVVLGASLLYAIALL